MYKPRFLVMKWLGVGIHASVGGSVGLAHYDGSSNNETSYEIIGGYQFNKNIRTELSYLELIGDVKGVNTSLIGGLPISNQLDIYARIGYYSYSYKSITGSYTPGDPGPIIRTESKRYEDINYGIDVSWKATNKIRFNLDYQNFDFDYAVDNISISASYALYRG